MGGRKRPRWVEEMDPDLLDAFVDNPYECPIVIDREGIVRFMSRFNKGIYRFGPEEALGRHITEVNRNTLMPKVLETGKAEIGKAFRIRGRQQIIARIPLKDRSGRVIGVLAKLMFHETQKLKEVYHRLHILEEQVRYYQEEMGALREGRLACERIIGESRPIADAKKTALKAAASDAPVLITGESGTGKELLANAVHYSGPRASGPFIRVNCAAIPHELIESELFGYEPGAFTGASPRGKPGKFELAHKGTIFLDEIGDMPLRLQARLLRVIQEKEVERVGGTRPVKLDFRVIAATNQDLKAMLERGEFRSDLYYRLNIFHVRAPSLREIPEDIPRIAYFLLSELRRKNRSAPARISAQVMDVLKCYHWPGNVRELRNALERAMYLAKGQEIALEDLPEHLREAGAGRGKGRPTLLKRVVAEAERKAILEALHRARGNKAEAARALGIHRTGLYQKMRRHRISV